MAKLILAATDGSEGGTKALELAAELARGLGGRVAMVHVMGSGRVPDGLRRMAEIEHVADPPGSDYVVERIPSPHPGDRIASLAREDHLVHEFLGRRVLDEAVQQVADHGAEVAEQILQQGDPADRILEAASQLGADMIVVGSRGLGPVRAILGSVSHKVAQLADRTCVIAR